MTFELEHLIVEREFANSALTNRVRASIATDVPVRIVDDSRDAARPQPGARDSFGTAKRRLILARRRSPFLMACPAGSSEFACCGYQVLTLASNCPMDCSYCFLQEYLADNPGFQIFANYADCLEELDRLSRSAPVRQFRIGTGELADSLAFDSVTGISRDLIDYFSTRNNLTLELKTKTDEIGNLLEVDPRGRVLVSWTLSTDAVWRK
ncbi:MAG: Radical domain protein, partial [Candidatus Binatus sp.]|nr:Radical domain protein [Candidatus Binatus sp.]